MKTLDDLLWDGKLKIYQDTNYFKYSIDSVLLAKFVTIKKSTKKILDIGTGNAPIPIMLSKRTKAKIYGIEIQPGACELAKESVSYNKLDDQIEIINEDIINYYSKDKNNTIDTILCNPPYYKQNMKSTENKNKKTARNEANLNLNSLFEISKKILKDGGNIAVVLNSSRLIECINAMRNNSIEPKKIQFVYPKDGRVSNIFLIEGTKNGKSGIKILESIVLQNIDGSYTKYVEEILKNFGKY